MHNQEGHGEDKFRFSSPQRQSELQAEFRGYFPII